MGGLLSSWLQGETEPHYSTHERLCRELYVPRENNLPTLKAKVNTSSTSTKNPVQTWVYCPEGNRPLRNKIPQEEWSTVPSDMEYILVTLPEYSQDYRIVQNLFKSTTQKHFKVRGIKRVQNPYLLGCFLLKKDEMKIIYGSVNQLFLFHGTKKCKIENICQNNFNWRLHGDCVGNRFGKGVSFSPIAYYASHYSDVNEEIKIMFLVRVLCSKTVVGNGNMILPPPITNGTKCFDTAIKENGHVVVKFCDNEFYPEYLIYYTGSVNKNRNSSINSSWGY